MGISVFPTATLPVAVQPLGTTSLVFNGYSSYGGYEYPSTLDANSYLAYASSGTSYIVGANDSGKYSTLPGGAVVALSLSTTESKFAISNPLNWGATVITPYGTSVINAITYGNGVYVAAGAVASMATSTDGTTWTTRTSGFGSSAINALTYGNGVYVAGGAGGTLRTSTDGITWTARTSNFGTTIIQSLAYGNNTYVAVGSTGQIRSSTDAITWTTRTNTFGTNIIYGVRYLNNLFIATGGAGSLAVSTDGITWTSRTSGQAQALRTVTYGKKASDGTNLYIIGGDSGGSAISTDNITWTTMTTPITAGSSIMSSLAYGNGYFIFSSSGVANVYTSSDGTSWTSRPNTSSYNYNANFYNNGLFIAGGQSGQIVSTHSPVQLSLYKSGGTLN
jgi:hypothetical protein